MGDANVEDGKKASGPTGRGGGEPPKPPAAPVKNARPHRGDNLVRLEAANVTVHLMRGFAIRQGADLPAHQGPKELTMPLSEAYKHRARIEESSAIAKRWAEIQKERNRRVLEKQNVDEPSAVGAETAGE